MDVGKIDKITFSRAKLVNYNNRLPPGTIHLSAFNKKVPTNVNVPKPKA